MVLRPIVIALGSAALVAAAVLVMAPGRVWQMIGPPDLGEVDFAALVRRETPNDALACRPEFCPARSDIEAPVFAEPADEMYRVVDAAVAGEPRLEKLAGDAAQGTLRYVQRSRVLRFPDTINVKVAALPGGGSTVLIYSRSQLGRSDLGVNRARIERWIGLIVAAARN
jgi:hypothetical protein